MARHRPAIKKPIRLARIVNNSELCGVFREGIGVQLLEKVMILISKVELTINTGCHDQSCIRSKHAVGRVVVVRNVA